MINRRPFLASLAFLLLMPFVICLTVASAPQAGSELAASNNAFAFDLYAQVASIPGNQFLSPYSISSALAMAYAGAKGNTEAQMACMVMAFPGTPRLFNLPAARKNSLSPAMA